jgi:hypothetical protein
MKMNQLCMLATVGITGLWLGACPPASETDAGTKDAVVVDAVVGDDTGNNPVDSGCSNATPCGEITPIGECSGTTLRFCDDNCLLEQDCAQEPGGPYSCGLIGSFHDCLAGAGQACEPDYWGCDPATDCTGNYPCDPQGQLSCVEEVCIGGVDAGHDDAHLPDVNVDDASADDVTVADAGADDTNTVDTAVIDDAAIDDAGTQDMATAEDAQMVEDATTSGDAMTVEDAGIEDAGAEDAA